MRRIRSCVKILAASDTKIAQYDALGGCPQHVYVSQVHVEQVSSERPLNSLRIPNFISNLYCWLCFTVVEHPFI